MNDLARLKPILCTSIIFAPVLFKSEKGLYPETASITANILKIPATMIRVSRILSNLHSSSTTRINAAHPIMTEVKNQNALRTAPWISEIRTVQSEKTSNDLSVALFVVLLIYGFFINTATNKSIPKTLATDPMPGIVK